MKTFKNSKGIKIFELDYNGNLYISGDLTLSPESTITAGNIKALVDADITVIRQSIDMATPYLGKAGVVYYLGETTEEYTYGTWWEKYIIGYNCTIDVSYTKVPNFNVYEGSSTFYVTDNDIYSHNKEILDMCPTTNKIVVTAVNIADDVHWEIKYYNESALLYTDIIESSFFTDAGYNFPFSPVSADNYPEGSTDIIINVQSEYALQEINAIDWESFMPKNGGEFQGMIYTKDIAPLQADVYSIGTETGRYKNGYFTNLYTGYLKTSTLSIENIDLEKFSLSSSKNNIDVGDGLIITDITENNTVKSSSILKFSGDKTKYLRQDGQFTTVDTTIRNVQDILAEQEVENALIRYTGNTVTTLKQDELYTGTSQSGKYQILFTGIDTSFVTNACVINCENVNFGCDFLQLFNNLFNESIENIINRDGKIILNYNKSVGWTVKNYEQYGTITDQQIKDAGILDLVYHLNGMTIKFKESDYSFALINNYFKIETISDNAQIIINKFVWEPLNKTEFDFINKDYYLSKAGTWEKRSINLPYTTLSLNAVETDVDINSLKFEDTVLSGMCWVKTPDSYASLGEIKNGQVLGYVFSDYIMKKPTPSGRPTPYYRQLLNLYTNNQLKKYSREGFHQGIDNSKILVGWNRWKKIVSDNVESTPCDGLRVPTKEEWNYIINEMGYNRRGFVRIGNRLFFCIIPKSNSTDLLFSHNGEVKTMLLSVAMDYVENGYCIMLPMAGYRIDDTVRGTESALYASATKDDDGVWVLGVDTMDFILETKPFGENICTAVRLVTQDSSMFKVDPIVINGRNLYFAPSNLQRHSNGTFKFAKNFYDTVGEDNIFGEWKDLFDYNVYYSIEEYSRIVNLVNYKADHCLTQ